MTEFEIALRTFGEKYDVEYVFPCFILVGYEHLTKDDVVGHRVFYDDKHVGNIIDLVSKGNLGPMPRTLYSESRDWWIIEILDFELLVANEGVLPTFPTLERDEEALARANEELRGMGF